MPFLYPNTQAGFIDGTVIHPPGVFVKGADGLIIGSPNYLSEMTASFRALYERLIFQNLTYILEQPCCNEHPARVLLIMTSNAPDTGYVNLVRGYQQTLNRFVGPTETLVSGNTLQLRD